MPVLLPAPGVIVADQTVTITPQVTGTVFNIPFQEGQEVGEGQLLFELDPKPFVESLNQAVATLWRDEATLEQNLRDAKRNEKLAKKEYVTIQQAEQARTIAKAQQAIVNADIAAVRQAEIQLGYTKIYSPIAGKTGNVIPQVGTLVTANTTPLVVVNSLDPVLVEFSLTQTQLKSLLDYQKKEPLTVQVMAESAGKIITYGQLVFTDNTVNPQTGTVLFKARIPNCDRRLWPGMMVSVNLVLTTEPNAIVVPIGAIKIDQQGNYLYAVENGKAIIKRLEISREIDNLAVISKGLSGKETVILTIPPDLSEGDLVQISTEGTAGSKP
jgi:multidrug efflux system membrane fusion protein